MKLERLIVYRKVVRYLSFDFLQNLCYDINMRLLCYFCFIKCIKYESSASSEIVSESTETQKEEPKKPEAQKEPSKESEKSNRKKAYVIFFELMNPF